MFCTYVYFRHFHIVSVQHFKVSSSKILGYKCDAVEMGNSMNFWSVLGVATRSHLIPMDIRRMESSSARCHLSHGFGAGT